MGLKRPNSGPGSVGAGRSPTRCAWAAGYPSLVSFMFDDAYDDGKRRLRGTVSLSSEGDQVRIALNCKDTQSFAFLTASDLSTAFAAADVALADDTLHWRRSQPFSASRGKP